MRLDFKILWFDDQPDNISEIQAGIRQRLAREGFNLVETIISKFHNIDSRIGQINKDYSFDLILMDYDLGQSCNEDGVSISKKLRRNNIYSDIVFYSAKPVVELRKDMCDAGVDGVYCINRDPSIIPNIMGIIDFIIKRMVDVNQMRGLFMESVSEFDETINSILLEIFHENKPEDITFIINEIQKSIDQIYDSNKKKLTNTSDITLNDLIYGRFFSSHMKQSILLKLADKMDNTPSITRCLDVLKLYNQEIIAPRNLLAHSLTKIENKKITFLNDKQEEIYDEAFFKKMRIELLKHRDNFKDFLIILQTQKGNDEV